MKYNHERCNNQIKVHLRKIGDDDNKTVIRIFPCRQWKCPICGQRNAFRLRKRIIQGNTDDLKYFLTLTLRKNNDSIKYNVMKISEMFAILKKRMRRLEPNFKYFKVIEFTKQNMPHYHILMNVYISKAKIKEMWREITYDSYIVDIQKLRQKNYNYILKYLLKTADKKRTTRRQMPKNYRIWTCSRGLLIVYHQKAKYRLITFVYNIGDYLCYGKFEDNVLENICVDYVDRRGNSHIETIASIVNFLGNWEQINDYIEN